MRKSHSHDDISMIVSHMPANIRRPARCTRCIFTIRMLNDNCAGVYCIVFFSHHRSIPTSGLISGVFVITASSLTTSSQNCTPPRRQVLHLPCSSTTNCICLTAILVQRVSLSHDQFGALLYSLVLLILPSFFLARDPSCARIGNLHLFGSRWNGG